MNNTEFNEWVRVTRLSQTAGHHGCIKHAKVVNAWLQGRIIESRSSDGDVWLTLKVPPLWVESRQYRVFDRHRALREKCRDNKDIVVEYRTDDNVWQVGNGMPPVFAQVVEYREKPVTEHMVTSLAVDKWCQSLTKVNETRVEVLSRLSKQWGISASDTLEKLRSWGAYIKPSDTNIELDVSINTKERRGASPFSPVETKHQNHKLK